MRSAPGFVRTLKSMARSSLTSMPLLPQMYSPSMFSRKKVQLMPLSGILMGRTAAQRFRPRRSREFALTRFGSAVDGAYREIAPHRICSYIYDLANAFNRFYHETRIMTEKDETQKASWIALLELTRRVLETAIDLLGFAAPEKM